MNAKRPFENATRSSGQVNTRADAFEVLGLSPDATPERIRRAYRRLAFKHHPDRNPSDRDAHRFKRITRAYHILGNRTPLDPNRVGQTEGACQKCAREGELYVGLDRNQYCRDCLLTIDGHRGLPAPPVVFATFGFAIATLLASCVTLAMFAGTGRVSLGWTTLVLSGAAFVSIAITAITIGQTGVPKRPRHRKRRLV